ncbi:hypothetical protein OGM63_24475 [Plectonema radiosum NIES-515]|uniref:Uncharacterized protein n=1 Tax=Plectonema radiosum NIES-515 TaxID=2986073 RepID=A0ABT3B6W8_9CYAN|nr:hypothetical protein [Plectonema radiosum]MCV3216624.1 hypothetical protein [Plectonema radiosum NIES-515]
MPLMTVRWSLFGLPVRGFDAGGNGFNLSHCSLLKSPRFIPSLSLFPSQSLKEIITLVFTPSVLQNVAHKLGYISDRTPSNYSQY